MIRYIGIVDSESLGISNEVEVLGLSEVVATALKTLGYIREYNDIKPLIGKSLNPYQELPYDNGIQVYRNDSIYVSNVGYGNKTSSTWVQSEWTCVVHGTQSV